MHSKLGVIVSGTMDTKSHVDILSKFLDHKESVNEMNINAAINIRNEAVMILHNFNIGSHAGIRILANSLH